MKCTHKNEDMRVWKRKFQSHFWNFFLHKFASFRFWLDSIRARHFFFRVRAEHEWQKCGSWTTLINRPNLLSIKPWTHPIQIWRSIQLRISHTMSCTHSWSKIWESKKALYTFFLSKHFLSTWLLLFKFPHPTKDKRK